jgi:hypothetical protein
MRIGLIRRKFDVSRVKSAVSPHSGNDSPMNIRLAITLALIMPLGV